ncbi:glutamate--tRNA ligase [Candidatus Woesearchaeota archaeon]|nr:glutamate--tRNA ligase [Candidatus Woesearchaeota archaeon]
MKDDILKFALQNAVQFKGKANEKAVLGKVLSSLKGKKDIKKLSAEVSKIVAEVNRMKPEDQFEKLRETSPELLEKKKAEKRKLPPLKKAVKGKVITRIPPEPSKYTHLGHALSFLINYMYAEEYEGKCLLRFEDTNPGAAKKEYVDAITEDIEYLGIKPDKILFASDDVPKMHSLAEQLIKEGEAYVCFCDREKMHDLRHKGLPCDCREKEVAINVEEWRNMLLGKYKEGECVLRLRGDLEAENQVMRDPVIFRISYEEHFMHKKKFCVWPLYDFENAVEDGIHKITHIMRSIEFGEMRVELQDCIKKLLKLPKQEVIQYGRFKVIGAETQGRVIREMIEKKEISGWDDPRLVTIKALKRRGIQPETFKELAVEVGLSTTPTNIDWSVISAYNRKLLDPKSNRYFFIPEPKKITVEGAPKREVEIKLHPDKEEKRKISAGSSFYIPAEDMQAMKEGSLYRLMDCMNIRKKGGKFVFDSLEVEKYRKEGKKILQWVPADEKVEVEVLMPDAKLLKGFAEKSAEKIKEGEIVQFVRFGFCRKEKDSFIYTHD